MVTTMSSNATFEADDSDVLPELIQNEQNTGNTLTDSYDPEWDPDAELSSFGREFSQEWTSSYPGSINLAAVRRQFQSQSSPVANEEQVTQSDEAIAIQNPDQNTDEGHADTVEPVRPPLTGIEACIDRIMRNPVLARDSSGRPDTFIYIGRLCIQNRDLEDQLQEYFCNNPILVERSKLEALNSPYFNKCLGGMCQTRKWKALNEKVALHVLPHGIKYVINMTPAIEGNEAVQSIQDLSCPYGVLHWKKSRTRWANCGSLVGGLDENDCDVSPDATAMEYSCVRHVKSIERFMTALQGNDPKFDSAPKLYTSVMVSKPWGIQGQHPLTDYVARWLYDHDGNSNFVEAFPEIVLEMADVLKCAPLCQDAFGILVGEAALDSIVTHPFSDGKTVYERVHGDIEEDWLSRIQHARNSFIDRVKDIFNSLAGEHMEWVASLIPVHNAWLGAQQSGKTLEFNVFLHLLKNFIRGAIYKLLCDRYDWVSKSQDLETARGGGLYPQGIEDNVWSTLRAPERIFTAGFWRVMSNCYLKKDNRELLTNHNLVRTIFIDRDLSPICAEYAGGPLMEKITIKSLIVTLPMREPAMDIFQYHNTLPVAKKKPSRLSFGPSRSTTQDPSNTVRDYSKPPVDVCSKVGCLKMVNLLSTTRSCVGCKLNFCHNHISEYQHHCYALHFTPASYGQEKEPFKFSDTDSSDGDDTPNQDNEYRGTIDPTLSVAAQHQKALFLIQEMLVSAVQHIRRVSRQMLSGMAGGNLGTLDNSGRITHTLNCLTEDEIKFLPLWAEGLDDGTGGVFGEHIPSTNDDNLAFRSNGRRLVTRSEGSDYSFLSETVDSTVNTSTIAHDGYRDTLPRGRVVTMDEVDSSSEGGWSYIQDTIDDKKGKACAVHTQEASEIATTLGALEDDSVINPDVKPSRTNPDKSTLDEEDMEVLSFTASSPGTIREADDEDDIISEDLEDSYNGFEEDFDDDMEMMFNDDLAEASSSKQTQVSEKKAGLSNPITGSSSVLTWSGPKSDMHVSYIYKDDSDYDLMTRP